MRLGSNGPLLGTYKGRNGMAGAGGWVTGFSIAADGTKMIRTDTYNGYTAPAGTAIKWTPNLKAGINVAISDLNMFYTPTGGEASPWCGPGAYDVAIAPSNSAVRYQITLGRVYVTQDSGASWTRCTLASKLELEPNAPNRMMGKSLVVDPQNPAVCMFASPQGLHYTTDYGVTWTAVLTSVLPAPTPGNRCCIAYDPSSAVTGGKKQGLYCFVNGVGLHHSVNAGVAWTLIAGSPTSPLYADHCKVGSNGYVYLAGDGGGNNNAQFRRWNGVDTWLEPAGINCKSMAISPFNAGHVYICGPQGNLGLSKDYGATWELGGYMTANVRLSPAIPWQQFTIENYMSNGDMEFDTVTNRLWVVEGIGVWYMDNPPTAIAGYSQTATWTSCSIDIENMVSFPVAFSDAGMLVWAIGDRAAFTIPQNRLGKLYPDRHPTTGGAIQNSCGGDWVSSDPLFAVYATTFCGSAAFTLDGGETYTMRQTLASTPGASGIGGNIVAFDKDRWVLVESNAGNVWRTADRGLTWTRCVIGTDTGQMWHAYFYHCRRIIVRDQYTPGRAYAYNHGSGAPISSSAADRGIWRTDDYGVTWTNVHNDYIIAYGADYYHGKLSQYGPNKFVWCGGDNALGLWYSADGCVTWNRVMGTDDVLGAAQFGEVYGVGIAKGATGSAHPAVLVAGYRMITPINAALIPDISGYGFWISVDGMATWKRTTQFLNGNFDLVQDIAGDPTTFARFFVGQYGSGGQIVDYDYPQAWN